MAVTGDPIAFEVSERELRLIRGKRRAMSAARRLLGQPAAPDVTAIEPIADDPAAGTVPADAAEVNDCDVRGYADQFTRYRGRGLAGGWACCEGDEVREVGIADPSGAVRWLGGVGEPSPDVAALLGESAAHSRFRVEWDMPAGERLDDLRLTFRLASGRVVVITHPAANLRDADPAHALNARFRAMVLDLEAPRVLELGSRARLGTVNNEWLSESSSYVGFDIVDGPNVDVLGDLHELSSYFPPESFDAAFSYAVFEHVAMPWKAVAELSVVLRTGALVLIAAPQTWPVHEVPWDYWRYSETAWDTLFNEATGFELLETAVGEPAEIVPNFFNDAIGDISQFPCYLLSVALARRVGPARVSWDVKNEGLARGPYPA